MNISTIGMNRAKKRVAGSRRTWRISLRATVAVRCSESAADMAMFSLLRRLGPRERKEHIFQVWLGRAHFRVLQAEVRQRTIRINQGKHRLTENSGLTHARLDTQMF